MAKVVLACDVEDLDTQSGTCANEVWVPQSSALPVLTIEEAQAIGVAVAYLLALAFAIRKIRQFLETFN